VAENHVGERRHETSHAKLHDFALLSGWGRHNELTAQLPIMKLVYDWPAVVQAPGS
jgi:hypothetical protein